jgi:hypothetical protein
MADFFDPDLEALRRSHLQDRRLADTAPDPSQSWRALYVKGSAENPDGYTREDFDPKAALLRSAGLPPDVASKVTHPDLLDAAGITPDPHHVPDRGQVGPPRPIEAAISAGQGTLDNRERAYNDDPAEFERQRMAKGPTSGELRFTIPGQEERSFNVGANRADMNMPDVSAYHDDKVFGQSRSHVPSGGGGVSFVGGDTPETQAEAYKRYLDNTSGAGTYDTEIARGNMAHQLAADPYARERALAGIDIGKTLGVAKGEADLRLSEQSTRRNSYLNDAEAEHREFVAAMDAAKNNKVKQQQLQERYQQRQEMLKQAYGFGQNLSTASIYKDTP